MYGRDSTSFKTHPIRLLAMPVAIIASCCFCCSFSLLMSSPLFHLNSVTTQGTITDLYTQENPLYNRTDYILVYTFQARGADETIQTFTGTAKPSQAIYQQSTIGMSVDITYTAGHPSNSQLTVLLKDASKTITLTTVCLFFAVVVSLCLIRFYREPYPMQHHLHPSDLQFTRLGLHPDFGKPLRLKKSPYKDEKSKKKRIWRVNSPKDDSYFS